MEAVAFGPLSLCNNGINARSQRWQTALWNPISILLLNSFSIQTCVTTALVYTCKRIFQTSARTPKNQCKHQQLCVIFLYRCWCVNSLKRALPRVLSMRIWYLSFHLSWVLGPFDHGGLQNLKTNACRHFWRWHNPFNRYWMFFRTDIL